MLFTGRLYILYTRKLQAITSKVAENFFFKVKKLSSQEKTRNKNKKEKIKYGNQETNISCPPLMSDINLKISVITIYVNRSHSPTENEDTNNHSLFSVL